MATELFSLWGLQTGWRAQCGVGFSVTAQLDGRFINYYAETSDEVERMFYGAARRSFLRRFFPWMAPPPAELGWPPAPEKTVDDLRTGAASPGMETKP